MEDRRESVLLIPFPVIAEYSAIFDARSVRLERAGNCVFQFAEPGGALRQNVESGGFRDELDAVAWVPEIRTASGRSGESIGLMGMGRIRLSEDSWFFESDLTVHIEAVFAFFEILACSTCPDFSDGLC